MAIARPFAYNPSLTPIDGTTQVGDLAVGVPTSGFTDSPQFWNGPNEELGYVIAVPISGNTQPTPVTTNRLYLSPTYKATDIALSNNNQTATQVFSYSQSVLGETLIGDNYVMFSIQFNSTNPSVGVGGRVIGFGTTEMNYQGPFDGYPGNDDKSYGFSDNGNLYFEGSVIQSGLPTWGDNDIIDIGINGNANTLIWIRVNGGLWNNSVNDIPEDNEGGINVGGVPIVESYPALCPYIYGSMTIQNYPTYKVPTGYKFLGNVLASVKFFRTSEFTDNSFINLAQYVSDKFSTPQTFTSADEASIWLTDNGFWNSYLTPVLYLDAGNPLSYPGTGTVWTDLIGGKVFDLINGPIPYSPSYGGGLYFNTFDNQYAECTTSLPDLSNWTLGVWHYYDGTNNPSDDAPCIITEIYPGTTAQINYVLGSIGNYSNLQTGFFNAGWNQTTNGYTLTTNTWNYIVSTYDGSQLKLYVNNDLIFTTNTTTPSFSSNGGIRLMRRWDLEQYWGGGLATVAIYDRALDSTQIDSIWNITKSRFFGIVTTNLQLYLDAGDPTSYPGTGNVWYDLSGNGNDVTMQNSGNISWDNGGFFTLTSNGYFNNTSTTNLPIGSSPYTLSVWVQFGSIWGNQGMISVSDTWGSGNSVNAFRTNGTNGLINYWWGNDLAALFNPPDSEVWFNFVVKWDGTNRSIWANGVAITEPQTVSGINVSNGVLNIGNTNNGEYLQGNIGQALIYDVALSSTEILKNFNSTKSNFGY